jgi:hypothetical protein
VLLQLMYVELEFNGAGLEEGVDKTEAKPKVWLLLLEIKVEASEEGSTRSVPWQLSALL